MRFTKVEAPSREAKLKLIENIQSFASLDWKACADQWQAPLRPAGTGPYFDWIRLTDIFPFHTAGAVFYRTWPIGETKEVLSDRWDRLRTSRTEERASLFKESRDRKISHKVSGSEVPGNGQSAIRDLKPKSPEPNCIPFGYRALDRQFAYYDFRLGDYLRPSLAALMSENQVFLVAPDTLVPGEGPCIIASECIPDQHYFRGSFGGRDVIPLYRDPDGVRANVTTGLLTKLGESYGTSPPR